MYDITIQQIEAFLTAGHFLNVSRAAEALYVSQPTLSKMLSRFESRVGFQVFTRTTQGVTLTPQGKYLLDALGPLYSNLEHAISAARQLEVSASQTLHIVIPTAYNMVEDYLPLRDCLDVFKTKHPEIHIRKHLCDLPELQWQFSFGNADLIIAPDFVLKQNDSMGVHPISPYVSCLALNKDRFPNASTSSFPSLVNLDLYVAAQGDEANAQAMVRRLCQTNAISTSHLVVAENLLTLIERLSEGGCAAILPRISEPFSPENIIYLPLRPIGKPLRIVAVWRKDRFTPQLKALLDELPRMPDEI